MKKKKGKKTYNVGFKNRCSVWWTKACWEVAFSHKMAAEDHKSTKQGVEVWCFDPIVNIVEAVNKKAMLSVDLSSINSVWGPQLLFISTVSAHVKTYCSSRILVCYNAGLHVFPSSRSFSLWRLCSQGLLLRRISAAVYLLIASFSLLTTTS